MRERKSKRVCLHFSFKLQLYKKKVPRFFLLDSLSFLKTKKIQFSGDV